MYNIMQHSVQSARNAKVVYINNNLVHIDLANIGYPFPDQLQIKQVTHPISRTFKIKSYINIQFNPEY